VSDDRKPLTEKQQRVLDAALEMFAERGYAGVATNEIAKKAGVAEGTIFKTWKTKKDLLVAVVAPLFFKLMAPRLLDELRALVDRPWPDAEALLRALLADRMRFAREHQMLIRVVLQELPFHDEVRRLAQQTVVQRLWPTFEATWTRLQAEGKVVDVPAHVIMRNVFGSLAVWILVRLVVAPEVEWDEKAEEDWLVRLLLDGIRPR
jgi:AcrR family transcriptional regulator